MSMNEIMCNEEKCLIKELSAGIKSSVNDKKEEQR